MVSSTEVRISTCLWVCGISKKHPVLNMPTNNNSNQAFIDLKELSVSEMEWYIPKL